MKKYFCSVLMGIFVMVSAGEASQKEQEKLELERQIATLEGLRDGIQMEIENEETLLEFTTQLFSNYLWLNQHVKLTLNQNVYTYHALPHQEKQIEKFKNSLRRRKENLRNIQNEIARLNGIWNRRFGESPFGQLPKGIRNLIMESRGVSSISEASKPPANFEELPEESKVEALSSYNNEKEKLHNFWMRGERRQAKVN